MKQLKAGGPRTVVKESEAAVIRDRFENELLEGPAVELIDLSCRSWPRSSLEVLRPVLEQVSSSVLILKLDDIIASLPTEAGLDSLAFFSQVFGHSQVLEELNFNDNALGSRGDEVLAPLIGLPSLRRLSIENCGMSESVAASLLEKLAEPSHLSLGRNQMGPAGARHVGTLVARCHNLQVFNYNGARPLKLGTAHLLQGLADMAANVEQTSLIQLNLCDCTIGLDEDGDDEDTPLGNLVQVLQKSPHLLVLNLQDGEIGPSGLKLVLDALAGGGVRLTHLALGGCELGVDGAQILSLEQYWSYLFGDLRELTLDTNELGDEGLELLIPMVLKSKLTLLDLESNEIGKRGAQILCQYKIKSLHLLKLADNGDIPAKWGKNLSKIYPQVSLDDELEEGDDDDDEEQVDDLAQMLGSAKI